MKTVLEILDFIGPLAPGFSIRIENEPYMRLCIEDIQTPGPRGLPSISVAHYGELNGDLMRDPEMIFEMRTSALGRVELVPYYWRNDYVGIEQYSRFIDNTGAGMIRKGMFLEHQDFAAMWDANIRDQGYLAAVKRAGTKATA